MWQPGIMANRQTCDMYEAMGSRLTNVVCDSKLMLSGLQDAFA